MTEPAQQIPPSSMTIAAEDRSLAIMTHLAGLAGYVIPLGGVLVPIVIWVVKSENRTIAAIAKQAVFLNVIVFVLALLLILPALAVLAVILAFLVGWLALAAAALVLPFVGAVKASDGEFYSYPVLGIRP